MTLLVDASVWVALATSGEKHREVAERLFDSAHPTAALEFTLLEVANVLGSRMGERDRARQLAGAIVRRCSDRLIPVDPELLAGALDVVAEHGLTAYDAAYVAASRRTGWQLVSIDYRDLVDRGLAIAPDAAL